MTTVQQQTKKPTAAPQLSIVGWVALGLGVAGMFAFIVRKMWYGWYPAWGRAELDLYHRFTDGESYYTHGPLVLALSGWLLWFLFRRARIVVKPSVVWGTVAIVSALLLFAFASVIGTNALRALAWIWLLVAMVLRFWGTQALGRLWFPLAFLFFMVPMPTWLISDVNLELKMAVTKWGMALAGAIGVVADNTGTSMTVWPDKPLVVGDICSGLRTIISLLAFGAAYTFVCRLPELSGATWENIRRRLEGAGAAMLVISALAAILMFLLPVAMPLRLLGAAMLLGSVCAILYGQGAWRILLFAMAIPVALVANTLRVTSLIVVTDIWDENVARGKYHDYSGLVVFVLAFLLMFALESLILAVHRWVGRPIKTMPLLGDLLPASQSRAGALLAGVGRWKLITLGLVGILFGAMAWQFDRPPRSQYVQHNAVKALPADLRVEDTPLASSDLTLDENTLTLLNTRDYLYRHYSGLEKPVDICIIFSKDNPTSSHPPELCLTAGGGEVLISKDVLLEDIRSMKPVGCRELVVQQKQGGHLTYYVYTFKYGKSYTKRFAWQQVWLFFKSRLFGGDASGALIRVSTPMAANSDLETRAARRRAQEFMRTALPHLDKGLN